MKLGWNCSTRFGQTNNWARLHLRYCWVTIRLIYYSLFLISPIDCNALDYRCSLLVFFVPFLWPPLQALPQHVLLWAGVSSPPWKIFDKVYSWLNTIPLQCRMFLRWRCRCDLSHSSRGGRFLRPSAASCRCLSSPRTSWHTPWSRSWRHWCCLLWSWSDSWHLVKTNQQRKHTFYILDRLDCPGLPMWTS